MVTLACLLAGTSLQAQQAPPAPCASAEHRQFDFWLGDWQVLGQGGKIAGTNRITRAYDGCVLREQYDTGRGYSGASFNIYDAGRKRWHQTWVDTSGTLLQLDGGLVDGRMVLEGTTVDGKGDSIRHRITWTPNPDGTVRQLWESTNAAGEWGVAFDGRYVKSRSATGSDCGEATTTYDMVQCGQRELAQQDELLQQYLAAARAHLDRGAPQAVAALDAAQAAWQEFREKQCQAVATRWQGGSISGPMTLECRIGLTRQRTHQLWADYLTYPDSTPPVLPEPGKP